MEKKASGINKIELSGNLVKDATAKVFESGSVVLNFRIAVNRKYKGRDGSEKTETMYINATAYPEKGKEGELEGLLRRGAGVHVKGTLTCRVSDWEGHKREFFEVRAFEVNPLAKAEKGGEKAA